MSVSFNLIDRGWIPCETLKGELIHIGFRELLVKAHEIRAIAGNSPLENIALFPPLLAILYRALGPVQSARQWHTEVWQPQQFSMEKIDAYFAKWHERFDLFDEERPFYQMEDQRGKPKSIIYLLEAIGNTGALFIHADESNRLAISFEEAAILMITAQQFRLGGGKSGKETINFRDSPLARGVIFWADGETLFETMALNFMKLSPNANLKTDDLPCWEMDNPFEPQRAFPIGYLDYLTWQTNRVKLHLTSDGIGVDACTIVPDEGVLSADVISPQKRYVYRETKDGLQPSRLDFNPDRALWRDYHTLMALDSEAHRPPSVVEWLAELAGDGYLDEDHTYHLIAGGLLADQAKPIFYREERLPLSRAMLRHRVDPREIETIVTLAEDIESKAVNWALQTLAQETLKRGGSREPDKGDVKSLVRHWGVNGLYWEQLERDFWQFIEVLEQDELAAREFWIESLEKAARETLRAAHALVGNDAASLKGQVLARRKLENQLKKLLKEES